MITFRFILCLLFAPLTIWYAVGVAVRNLFYRLKIKSSVNPAIPTIGIGNLRMGGTGKSPHTEYLIRLLSRPNSQVALLSRGYGRKTKGFLLADDKATAERIGDEPLMMHRKFPNITVAVCEDRAQGLQNLQTKSLSTNNPSPIVLLDDSYQHRHLNPGLMILLTEYNDLYIDDHILPFGDLREFRSGSHRADIIVVTKCPPLLSPQKRQKIRNHLSLSNSSNQKLFFSYIDYSDPIPLFSNNYAFPTLNSQLLLVSGIANPAPLKRHLERHSTVSHLNFPDHHKFSRLDCELIIRRYKSLKADNKAIVTTEKDAMRFIDSPFRHLFDEIPFFYIPIEVKFFEQNDFDSAILDFFHNFANRKKIDN